MRTGALNWALWTRRLLLPKHMRIDFGIIQCVSSNSTWCKPRAARKAKSLKSGGGGGGAGWAGLTRKKMFKVATPSLTLKGPWESLSGSWIHRQCRHIKKVHCSFGEEIKHFNICNINDGGWYLFFLQLNRRAVLRGKHCFEARKGGRVRHAQSKTLSKQLVNLVLSLKIYVFWFELLPQNYIMRL